MDGWAKSNYGRRFLSSDGISSTSTERHLTIESPSNCSREACKYIVKQIRKKQGDESGF